MSTMTVAQELHAFLMAMKRRRMDAGESADEVVGETAASLLIIAHIMAVKIGLTREDIIDQVDSTFRNMNADLN